MNKKFVVLMAVMAMFVLTVTSVFAAAGDTNQNTADMTKYTTEYGTPVVDQDGNTTLTVTNSYLPELVNISVTKIWDDDDNRDHYRPENICITLNASANGGAAAGNVHNYTLSAAQADTTGNQWSHTFEDLVKFYDGYQIAYTVTEDSGSCTALTFTETTCELSGGKWENNACTPVTHSRPATNYSSLTTQEACAAATPAGVWTPGSCSDDGYHTEEDCRGADETWTAGFCAAPVTPAP